MITLPFDSDNTPLYRQVYNEIKKGIQKGTFKSLEKIPSKRKLANHLCISVNTVDAAYNQLCAEGYIKSVAKKGYFVCPLDEYQIVNFTESKKAISKHPINEILIDFSPGHIDQSAFPFNIWRGLLKECFNEYDTHLLERTSSQGDIELRRAIVKFLKSSRGVDCNENQIIIGAGTDNLLQILSYIFGKDKIIELENPVYSKAYQIFQHLGHMAIPIGVDDQGIIIEQMQHLDSALVYVTPSHQFPLGISMPIGRRIQLLNFANESPYRYIIEDDYDSEFRYSGKPLPSLQSIDKNSKVIYIGTFSKSIAPSLRISYMVLPESLLSLYHQNCDEFSSVVSTFEQKVVTTFINEGHFEKHLNKMRKLYKDKRQHLINELSFFGDRIKVLGENAGHHLIVKLECGMSELEMYESALAIGIKVYPLSNYYMGEVPIEYSNQVLLGYGALSEKEISKGVKALVDIWK